MSRFSVHGLLADLEALVVRESPSDDSSAVTALAHYITERLRAAPVHAETRPCPPHGDAVLATVGEGGEGVLLLGHHDTVWPRGTLAEIPFRVEDGRVRGPGVFDMKAGIAVAMAVLADAARREKPPRVTLLLTPDEEIGTGASRPLVQDVARRAWGFSDRELPSTADLIATAHVGGVVAGAFAGREMLGFVTGLPRLGLGEPCLHSHMLAVVPEAQSRGLSVRLKLFQRRFCLEHGIRLVLRRLAESLFARGYEARSVVPGPRTALYLFELEP